MTTVTTRQPESTASPRLMMAFELAEAHWMLGFTTGSAQRARRRQIPARDIERLEASPLARRLLPYETTQSHIPGGQDFDVEDLKAAIADYASRVRRFGGRPDGGALSEGGGTSR